MLKLCRRRFLYTGAGATAIAGAYLTRDLWLTYLESALKGKPTPTPYPHPTETPVVNNPPIADFEYRPLYVKPYAGQEVRFRNLSKDPDGNPLTFKWYVDGNLESESQDFSRTIRPN